MKRVVKVETCRKCRSDAWEKHETKSVVHTIDTKYREWRFQNATIIKTWYACTNCGTKMFHDPLTETLMPEYNEFQREEYGERTKVKPQTHSDTALIKWTQKMVYDEMRPYNSYTLVLDEKGYWIDEHNNRVTCYSINGCGEVRWAMNWSSGSVDEISIVRKFKLRLANPNDKPYWLEIAEKEEQEKEANK